MNDRSEHAELLQLLARLSEEQLEAADWDRLRAMLADSADARRLYRRAMSIQALLERFGAAEDIHAGPPPTPPAPRSVVQLGQRLIHLANQPVIFALLAASSVLVGGMFLLGLMQMPRQAAAPFESPPLATPQPAPRLATLTATANCTWRNGASRSPGSGLRAGTLRLEQGQAELRFAQGATVLLTGPAEFRLVSAGAGYLARGELVARVPASARGFRVDTPVGTVTDLGTEFGMVVGDDGRAEVQVFVGSVHVQAANHQRRLSAGEAVAIRRVRQAALALHDLPQKSWQPITRSLRSGVTPEPQVRLTATRTVSLRPDQPQGDARDLAVKYDASRLAYSRKTWLHFDLSELAARPLTQAQLALTVAHAPYAGMDAGPQRAWEFELYGLLDSSGQSWDEQTLNWASAPGNNAGDGYRLDPTRTTAAPLARFELWGAGKRGQTVHLGDRALLEFLNERRGQFVTLVLVRRTSAEGRDSIVHLFAGAAHPFLPAPALELWCETAEEKPPARASGEVPH